MDIEGAQPNDALDYMEEADEVVGNRRQAKAGHQEILGETIAKFEMFKRGWNPYTRFLDQDKVDLVGRRNTGREIQYVDVQVKQSRLYSVTQRWARPLFDVTSWTTFKVNAFDDCQPNLVVAYILVHKQELDGQDDAVSSLVDFKGDIFLFKATEFAELLSQGIPKKGHQVSLYFARGVGSNNWYLWKKMPVHDLTVNYVVDVTRYRQNFSALDNAAFRHRLTP